MNDQQQQRITHLLEQYYHDRCTEAERVELISFLSSPENEHVVKALIQTKLENPEIGEDINRFLSDSSTSEVLTRIINPANVVVMPTKARKTWWSYAAAATLLLAVAGIWLFTPGRDKHRSIVTNHTVAPATILPGHEGAILQLANGREIVLDSSSNGELARQGNTSVVKRNGEVVYTASKTETEVLYNTMLTPKGRQYSLVLADGSRVWLNAASSITYPTIFTGNERKVKITGEAYFEVVHNTAQPFKVEVNGMTVQVLGTHFNINSYSDEKNISTTLLEGSVRIDTEGGSNAPASTVLKPGQQAQWNSASGLKEKQEVNLDAVVSWKNGYFYFEKDDVKTVMRQLARWYDIDVRYKDNVTTEKFGGKIQRNLDLSAVMEILATIGVRYKVEGHTLIVGSG
jgi:ferric-dicitrate binding protein FerR (iron transport regulator)